MRLQAHSTTWRFLVSVISDKIVSKLDASGGQVSWEEMAQELPVRERPLLHAEMRELKRRKIAYRRVDVNQDTGEVKTTIVRGVHPKFLEVTP
jgi:hypothetical protein